MSEAPTLTTMQSLCRDRIDARLSQWLSSTDKLSPRLWEAMRYSVLLGGKRLRPLLVYLTGTGLGASLDDCDRPAMAVELIHAYSLIHDDLPAMDDDALRRGQPTCHMAFDEATAILAGDGLQSLAFELLAHPDQHNGLAMVRVLAQSSGPEGMVGGQMLDLAAEGQFFEGAARSPEERSANDPAWTQQALEQIHRHKTGALIQASVHLGALAAQAPDNIQQALIHYASAIGLAFQVQDDILDITSTPEVLGKQTGADIAHDKLTYPALLGLDGARSLAATLVDEAEAALSGLPSSLDPLRTLAHYIISRDH